MLFDLQRAAEQELILHALAAASGNQQSLVLARLTYDFEGGPGFLVTGRRVGVEGFQ